MNSLIKSRKKRFNSSSKTSLSRSRTVLKEKFISLWDKLGTIYHRYRENLAELGIAYEGMLYRNVIEQLDTTRLKYDKYIFVGFNVLNILRLPQSVETTFGQFIRG